MISPPLSFPDLAGRRVGIWGLGVEGRATLARLARLGVEPAALVDAHPAAAGAPASLLSCEVVVKSPGISRYSPAVEDLEAAGVAVVGGMGLWLETVGPARVVGITGTKGKSTTTAVAGHLATRLGAAGRTGGNLGTAPWDPAAGPEPDFWIIEVSSYQATDLWSSPAVAAVTSLHPDHLDWHGTVDRYYRDKLSLCARPGARVTVANRSDPRLLARAGQLGPVVRWVEAGPGGEWTAALGLRGRHNAANALIAAACLEEMGVAGAGDPERLAAAAAGFRPLSHRLETVATLAGVEYVDDSLSTNVLPTLAALEAFEDRPVALIAGGFDRGVDYASLADAVVGRSAPAVVLTLPPSGQRIARAVAERGGSVSPCSHLAEAVRRAAAWAAPGSVVLLSPAAPSYGTFTNYMDRGNAFRAAVDGLRAPPAG